MRMAFDKGECQNLKHALAKEWLETNGLGGSASSTIIGTNTRRQHGLLVAALNPPVERYVLLSKFEERVVVGDQEFHLCTNLYPGTVFPHGFNVQTEFRPRPWPTFRYTDLEFEIEKSVLMVHGENTVVLGYRNLRESGAVELKLRPLFAFREAQTLTHRNDAVNTSVGRGAGVTEVQPYANLPRLYFHAKPDAVEVRSDWYYRFTYPVEQDRGLDFEEDLFTLFEMTLSIPGGQTAYIVVTTEKKNDVSAESIVAAERLRRKQFERETDPVRQALLIAGDAFVARRGTDKLTLLAGYPWFTDWGRDAMIALPGLTLATERFDAALQVLRLFAQYSDQGLIPNVFPDADKPPEYNTVDAALWFVVAAWRYWKRSGDTDGTRQLLPVMADIVRFYKDGTRFDIRADTDGLITAGSAGTQLTWMDVNVDGYIPTPRHGKPVEVNALWLNALLMLAEMQEKAGKDIQAAETLRKLADHVSASFVKTFWNADGGCLFDVVQGSNRDASIRPNQIFAVSLPYSPLDKAQQRAVLDVVTQHLLTPYGLRTLSAKHEKYCGRYTGNRWQRDCAYHQGTVWPWLIGPYCDAYVKVNGLKRPQRKAIADFIRGLIEHLDDACVGQVSEIFDGDPPHRPVGGFAHACSVAELLRIHDEYLS
jgi:predicted glycogen debranching enzyme